MGASMSVVDINCDMGESFGAYGIGKDEEVISYITSANVACGFHASDPMVMDRTIRLCKELGVMIGAHPGYPDLMGFGRRFLDLTKAEMVNYVIYQTGALSGFLRLHGLPLQHVKLHGALYNYMVNQEKLFLELAAEVCRAFGDVILLTLGTRKAIELKKRARSMGIRVALECFPDRAYTDDGELVGRQQKNAVFHDPAVIADRALTMVTRKGIESATGTWIDMEPDTLCIHGDNAESIEAARQIQKLFETRGIELRPLGLAAQSR
jgi:5-oxoprolinase (ATP-hydrolysing) subunit A